MPKLKLWITGARLRTLPLAIAPVILGSAVANTLDSFSWPLAVLAGLVALSLQVGVNFANDYSDGIRGTDKNRKGPLRLVGSGAAQPAAVKRVSFVSFGFAAMFGLLAVVLSGQWWLLLLGALSIVAAWFYTGGKSPYGYAGLGEIAVFLFFGLIATAGTTLIQTGSLEPLSLILGSAFGCYATAVLLVNNIRDIETDRLSGKKTIAVRLGDRWSRRLFVALIWLPVPVNLWLMLLYPATLIGLINLLLVIPVTLIALTSKSSKDLITALKLTSFAGLGFGLLVGLGIFLVNPAL